MNSIQNTKALEERETSKYLLMAVSITSESYFHRKKTRVLKVGIFFYKILNFMVVTHSSVSR